MNRTEAGRWVVEQASAQGFGLCGIAPARVSPHAEYVRAWIAQGRHGEMGYLKDHLDVRLDPEQLVAGARSVVVVADAYATAAGAEGPRGQGTKRSDGRIARYAWGDDYHRVIKKRLHALCDALSDRFENEAFRAAVDTAPVMEREFATAAGLGWIGKHTLMIHPRYGSWFVLGVIVTTLDMASSQELGHPGRTYPGTDHCGTCTRCIDACPTDAIPAQGYKLDATRCISYLTLEHRSKIDDDLLPGIGGWIAGCDICQEVCPHNREQGTGNRDQGMGGALPIQPGYAPRNTSVPLLDVLGWSAEDRQARFRGSALKRMKLEMVKRNALIAACNALREREDLELRRRIEALACDPDEHELVRDTAKQVLRLLDARSR